MRKREQKNTPIQWECPECGCRHDTSFGATTFVCPACGFEATGEALQKTYWAIKNELIRKPEFAELNRPAFQKEPMPEATRTQLRKTCPFLNPLERWSDLALFDVLWILKADPNAISILPLPTIKRTDWKAIEKVADGSMVTFAASIGSGKADSVASLIHEASPTDLQRQERLLTAFGWSHWGDSERDRIARSLLDAVPQTLGTSMIMEFSPETQLNLWRADPARSKIDIGPFVPKLSPNDFIFALKRGVLKPAILESISFERWTPKDWLALLRLPNLVLPDRIRIEIVSRWNELGWSADSLADLVANNPKARRFFPALASETMADMLLKHPDFSSWMSSEEWFNGISTQDWLRLLANEEVLSRPEVTNYAHKSILPKLSDLERNRLIEENVDIAAFYPIETLSEKNIVNLFSTGRHEAYFNGFDFSSLSRPGWLSLLSRCGTRIPVAATGFLMKETGEMDTATVEWLLSGNPALLPFFSEKQFAHLSTETFLRLCAQLGAPDFLVSAYPVKSWTRRSQIDFIIRYPWTAKYFDWSSWPIWTVDRIARNNRALECSYLHPGRLFIFRHWKWFSGLIAAILVAFGIGIASPYLRDMQASHERIVTAQAAAREQESKAEISRNTKLQAEADAKIKDAEYRIAKANAERAMADAKNAKAREAEAKAQKAKAETEKAKAEKAKAEAEKQTKIAQAQKAKADKEKVQSILGGVILLIIVVVVIAWKVSD